MIKLSIVIPVYNAEKYLSDAIKSVLDQSLKEIEVICIDGGSSDSSKKIIEDYAEKDSRIRLFMQQNINAGIARNNGIKQANGEYIHFLDADDYVLDYAYESVYDKASKHNLDCLKFCGIAYDIGLSKCIENSLYSLSRMESGDFNRYLDFSKESDIQKISSINISPWSGIYKRNFIFENNIYFDELSSVNGRSFTNKVYSKSKRIMLSRDRVVVNRVKKPRLLNDNPREYFDCHYKSIKNIERQLDKDSVHEGLSKKIIKNEFQNLFYWLREFVITDKKNRWSEILNETEQFMSGIKDKYKSNFLIELDDVKKICLESDKSEFISNKKEVILDIFYKKNRQPKVSIIVPIFNVEDYLNEALHSLHIQTLKEIEFICVNDGSTDNSLTILKQYAAVDKRFIILDGPNGGYGKAMNRGLDAASGEYIGILEPDDFVPKNMYEELYEKASENDLDFIKADFYRFKMDSNGHLVRKRFNLTNRQEYYNRVLSTSDDLETFRFVMNTWSGIYKLDFVRRNKIRHNETPGASYQDNGFFFQTFVKAKRVMFLHTPYYMNRRDNPNSSVFSNKKVWCMTDEYKYIRDFLDKSSETKEKFNPVYYYRKFVNFIETYYRITTDVKKEYVRHIYKEFLEVSKNDSNLMYFSELHQKYLNDILSNPDDFSDRLRISVIIPIYNAEKYLKKCLDSILARNGINFELICVNDGSTDSSLEILKEYQQKDSRVKIITQKNSGAGSARNTGMAVAKGDYYLFLDADDYFEPEMLRRVWETAYLNDNDITVFRSDQFKDNEEDLTPMEYSVKRDLLPKTISFPASDIDKNIFSVFVGWAWDKLFKAEFIDSLGIKFQELRTTNDMFFVFSALVKAQSISINNDVWVHHRRNTPSLSMTREKSWWNCYDALLELRKQLMNWGLFDRYHQDYINYALHFLFWNIDSLSGDAYYKIYNKAKEGWFNELEITGKESWFFYDKGLYSKYKKMLTLDADSYINYRLIEGSEYKTKFFNEVKQNKKLRQDNNKLRRLQSKLKSIEEFSIGKYIKYKIASKLTLGKARKKYKEKYQELKELYRMIRGR